MCLVFFKTKRPIRSPTDPQVALLLFITWNISQEMFCCKLLNLFLDFRTNWSKQTGALRSTVTRPPPGSASLTSPSANVPMRAWRTPMASSLNTRTHRSRRDAAADCETDTWVRSEPPSRSSAFPLTVAIEHASGYCQLVAVCGETWWLLEEQLKWTVRAPGFFSAGFSSNIRTLMGLDW